jgi:hypothetical protein
VETQAIVAPGIGAEEINLAEFIECKSLVS